MYLCSMIMLHFLILGGKMRGLTYYWSCKSWTSERQLFVFCLHHQCTFYQWTENWPKSAISRAWVCHFRNFAELQDKGALVQALCRQIYISATFSAKTRHHLSFLYIHCWLDARCTVHRENERKLSSIRARNIIWFCFSQSYLSLWCARSCVVRK